MSIKRATRQKLLAGVGTTVLATMIAGSAYAAEVEIPDLLTATASAHKTAEAVLNNSDLADAVASGVNGKLVGDHTPGTPGASTSNTVTDNLISAGATGNRFSNTIDLSLIEDNDDAGNSGLAALGVATNTGVITSTVENSSLSIDLTGFANGTAVNSDNTIRAQSTVNSGTTSIAGTIPNGYQSDTEGHSSMAYPSNPHEAEGSIVASSVQQNLGASGHSAAVAANEIGLSLQSDLANTVDSSPTLDGNTIDATLGVNSATSTIDLQKGGAPAFEGSAVVTNLQTNFLGSASASNSDSSIFAVVSGTTPGALNQLDGGLSVQGNTISSAASGNQSTGANGIAGNRILIGDQLAVNGAGTTAPSVPGSAVAYDAGDTAASSVADLVILNSQGNTGLSAASRLTIASATEDAVIGASVDSLDGGTVTLAGNKVASQAVGNSVSSAVQSGEGAAEFAASVALLNQQINYNADIEASTSDTSVTAVVGAATGGVTNESTVAVSGNRSAATAYGNDASQTIALNANTLNATGGSVNLTGGTTGATNDGNASATGAVTITSLQSTYNGNVSAENANSTIGLDADTRVGTPGDVIGSSTLSTDANRQEAVALGSSATNRIGSLDRVGGDLTAPGLSGNTVGAGAGIANVQIGDAESSVSSILSGTRAGVVASTHVEDGTLSVVGNLQRAIGYGTMATNTLSVDANSVNVADGGNGSSGTYNPNGDPFHATGALPGSQPAVNSSFGVLNDQSIQGPVTAAADGLIGVSIEGDVRGSAATNDSNALVAAAYGNDAANGIALDAGTLASTDFASVAHVGNAQAVWSDDASVSATASGGNVVLTDIEDDVLGSTISTSTNQVQALAFGNQASNGLGVSANTIDTSGDTGVLTAGLSLAAGELSGTTSFGVTNAQAGGGSVSVSLLNNPDPALATNSASVLTRIGGVDTTIEGSSVISDNNSLSAQATSNSADNTLGIRANGTAATSGVLNFQITDADVSARIGMEGQEYIAPTPFNVTATVIFDGYSESDGEYTWTASRYRIDSAAAGLDSAQIAALVLDGWTNTAGILTQELGEGSSIGAPANTADISGVSGGQDSTPNFGGVTIVAEGESIIGSTLSVDGNKVNGAVTGNSATNSLSVDAGTTASGSGLAISASAIDGAITTSADHSLLNQQAVLTGTLESSVAGSFGIATAEDAAISGSTFSVSGNSQRASSVANTAASTLDIEGNDVGAGSALVSVQGSAAAVQAASNVEVFAPGAVSSSSVDISGNTNIALGVINDATNTSTVSATNIATLATGLEVGEVGNAVLDLGDISASGDHVLQNAQTADTSVDSTAVTSLHNVDRAADSTLGLSDSTFTMNGNTTYAEASANRASNTMTLYGSATQGASGGVFNLQSSSADATANATTNAGLTLAGDTSPASAALSGSTVTLDGNTTTALAQGNSATNVLNSVAGANYGASTGTAGVQFSAIGNSNVAATAAVLNAQENTGAVSAGSAGATYQVALNAAVPGNPPAVTNGTVSVSGNSVAAQAFGNNAVNKISLVGLNTGTSTAALGNTQTNSGAITASVTGAQVGVAFTGLASSSSFSVGSNTISANAVGNSVSNTISRK